MAFYYKGVVISDLIMLNNSSTSNASGYSIKPPVVPINDSVEKSLPIPYQFGGTPIVGVAKYETVLNTATNLHDTTKYDKIRIVAVGGGGGGGGGGGQGNDDGPGTGPNGTATNGGWGGRGASGGYGYTEVSLDPQAGRYVKINYTIGNGGGLGSSGNTVNNGYAQYRYGNAGGTGGQGNDTIIKLQYSNDATTFNAPATTVFTAQGGGGGPGGPGGGNKSSYGPIADSNPIRSIDAPGISLGRNTTSLVGVNGDGYNLFFDGEHVSRGGYIGNGQKGAARTYLLKL